MMPETTAAIEICETIRPSQYLQAASKNETEILITAGKLSAAKHFLTSICEMLGIGPEQL
jgi:hypothetical protein